MKRAKLATWEDYFKNTKDNPPRPLLIQAMEFVVEKDKALDLGSGALNDSKYLLSQGFKHVIGLDKNAVAVEVSKDLPKDKFNYTISSFEGFNFPINTFDLVNAQYALPFINPQEFERVFNDICKSLKVGGILTGQFFGDRDEWKSNPEMTFVNKIEADRYLSELKVLSFHEEELDKKTAGGEMKHWHVFHFIAKKI